MKMFAIYSSSNWINIVAFYSSKFRKFSYLQKFELEIDIGLYEVRGRQEENIFRIQRIQHIS